MPSSPQALNKYRKSGIIRNRTYQPETQLRRWRAETEKWVNKAEACRREGARCVVRPQTARRVMGTIEAMAAAEPHIARGCWCDPWPMAQMYVCTKVQPVTGLQERLHIGDSGKNEVRHRTLNEIVEGIARLGEDVAEADIAFAIYQANREVDVLFGRVDEHSLSVFPWSDADLNADAADVLSGPPPFPLAAAPSSSRPPLGPLKPVREGDAEWEALGFDYLRHLEKVRSSQLVVAQAAQVAAQAIQAGEAEVEASQAGEAAQAGEAEAEAETEGQAAEEAAAEEEEGEVAEAEPMATAVVIGPGGDSSLPLLPADMVEVIPPQFGALSFAGDAPLSGDEEDLAALATSPRRSAAAAAGRGGGGGSAVVLGAAAASAPVGRWSAAHKSPRPTIANSRPIVPRLELELQLMAESMTEARQRHPTSERDVYDTAQLLYLQKVEQIFSGRSSTPPDLHRLRPNRTSAAALQQVAAESARFAQRAALDGQRRAGSSSQVAGAGSSSQVAAARLPVPLPAIAPQAGGLDQEVAVRMLAGGAPSTAAAPATVASVPLTPGSGLPMAAAMPLCTPADGLPLVSSVTLLPPPMPPPPMPPPPMSPPDATLNAATGSPLLPSLLLPLPSLLPPLPPPAPNMPATSAMPSAMLFGPQPPVPSAALAATLASISSFSLPGPSQLQVGSSKRKVAGASWSTTYNKKARECEVCVSRDEVLGGIGVKCIPLRILDRLARSDALTHPVRPTGGRAQRTADQVRREVLAQWPAGKATITLPAAEREPDGTEA